MSRVPLVPDPETDSGDGAGVPAAGPGAGGDPFADGRTQAAGGAKAPGGRDHRERDWPSYPPLPDPLWLRPEKDEAPETSLSPGLLLAGRYQILDYIGRGGMGEVYEALDLDLRVHIALKVVRPVLASDRNMMERFRREIQLSRRVTHPNVCRIFDLGRHRDERRDVTFLTMELLAGETLEARIRRGGKMAVSEAEPLVLQMTEALEAAHEVGVVHRDFKTSNVILVKTKDGATRAVVTDFGLARSLEERADAPALSSSGVMIGTAAYMAPEQVGGAEATRASDVYSLGVVLYEMVTGARPHPGESPIELLVNRLSEPPIAPRLRNPELPARWDTVILRCLERDPADRFASARDVARALTSQSGASSPADRQRTRVLPRLRLSVARRRWAAAFLAVLFLAGTLGSRVLGWGFKGASLPSRRSVAVLGFKDLAGKMDTGWLSPALTQMLSAELSAGEALRTIPSETVNRVKAELGLPDSETYGKETLARIRANLGADVVVLGSYLALDANASSPLRVDVRLQDTASGETLATVTENRSVGTIFDIVLNAGAQLRDRLGTSRISEEQHDAVRAALPADPKAARLYSEGLVSLARFDLMRARDLFRQSVELDDGHALAHSALAETLSALGLEKEAASEARKALETSAPLERQDRLLIEGRFHEASFQWEKAVETYRVLFGYFPDDVDHGLRLIRAQTRLEDTKGAMETLAVLRRPPHLITDDPRVDLAEASIANRRADFQRALVAAGEANRKGKSRGAKLIVAEALLKQARAQMHLGFYQRSGEAALGAQAIFQELDHPIGVLDARQAYGISLYAFGKFDEALALYEDGLRKARQLSSRYHEITNLAGLGEVHVETGDFAAAERDYQETLTISTAIGNRYMIAVASGNLAKILKQRGDLASARGKYVTCRQLFEEIGDHWRAAAVTAHLGDLERELGDLASARANYELALDGLKDRGDGYYKAWTLESLGELALIEGDLRAARKRLLESLEMRTRAKEKLGIAQSQLALAEVALEEGNRTEAERLALEARDSFKASGAREKEAAALNVLARVRLALGRPPKAEEDISAALALLSRDTRPLVRLSIETTGLRVAIARGKAAEVRDRLLTLVEEADSTQLALIKLEARLVLAEAEHAAGDDVAARRRVEEVEKTAREKGFVLVARRASTLLPG